jgi:hypothetical protein
MSAWSKTSAEKVTQQLHLRNKVYKIKLVESPTGSLVPCGNILSLHKITSILRLIILRRSEDLIPILFKVAKRKLHG